MRIKVSKGLNIPIAGEPVQEVEQGPRITKVALLGQDYIDLKPKMLVNEGDVVKLGQPLFTDRRQPDVYFTSPTSGKILSIVRGPKRILQAVIINVDGDDAVQFDAIPPERFNEINRKDLKTLLAKSGLWTALRTRPYSKIPTLDDEADAIFVTAMDSNPLAADANVVIANYEQEFVQGLELLTKLTDGLIHVCHGAENNRHQGDNAKIQYHEFSGPHPSGLAGTHMHFVEPVIKKNLWHIGYQDVIALAKLVTTGKLWIERIVSIAGPIVRNPSLIRTRLGASTEDIVRNNIEDAPCRVVSGPLLSGHRAVRWASFLGRYHTQICALPEGGERELLGWLKPTGKKFSSLNVLLNSITGRKNLPLNTLQNGSPRAIIPLGHYEAVMPLDLLATPLLKAIVVGDTDMAQKLGCLELDEEDLALCTFVCPGKTDFGRALRDCLTEIERNG